MRTTLEIDDDLLTAAKDIARRERASAGAVVSRLLRQALNSNAKSTEINEPVAEYGFAPFSRRGGVVSNELLDRLREETGD